MFFKISKFTKILAFATAVIFTLQSSLFASPTAALVSNASNVNSHLADSLDVPSNLGIVDHRYQANQSKEPFIIQIQDAHGQPEAQHHIHALLDYLTKNYDAKIISVESAFSKIEPELLKIFKDQTLNEAFVESLLQMGEVTGVETFALENKDPSVRILGAEDPRLYKESFKLYQKIQNAQNDWQPQLDQYQKIIDQLQMSIFQGELREYFLKQAEWRQQRENSLEYLILIRDYAKKYLNIDLNDQRNQFDWPALVRLMAIKNLEVNFNIETAFAEKEQLLGLFQEVFKNEEKKREYFNFVIDSFFKQQNIDEPISFKSNLFPQVKSARDFFETLRFETKDQIELLRFPHLLDMAGSYILREELDAARLLKELDRIEKKIQMSLVKTKGEKELLELSYGLDLLKKLFSLELSKDDFLHYQKQKKQLSSDAFQQRLNSFEKKFPKRDDKGGNFPQALMDEAEQFYELSLERDVSLIQNTLRHIEKGERNKPTILISGGFHTEGIGAVLKEKGISHVTISPKMSEIATEAIYRDAMLGHNLPYETGTIGKFLFAQAEESYRLGPLTPNDRVFLLISALQDFFSEQNELLDLETIVSQIREALTKLNPQAKFAIKVSSDGQRLELSIESEGIERNFALVDRGPTKLKSWPRGQERVLDSGIRSEMRLELDESVKKLLETIPDDNHGKRIRAALQSVLKLKNNTLLNDEKIDANQKSERGPFRSTKTDSVATPSRRVYNIENIANEAFNNHKIHDSNLPLLHKLIFALTVFDAKYFPDIHQAILNFISKHDLKDLASRTQIETEEYVELVRAYSKAERTMKASDNVLFRYAMNDLVLRMPRSERVAMEREYNATQMIKEIEQPGTGDVPTVIFFTDWHGATRIGSLIAKALGIEDYDRIYSVREMERRLIEQWKKDNPTEKEKSITVEEILAEKNVIIVGGSDYVDRGPKPYWGFQFNVWLRKHGKLRFINGNHDLWKDWNILGFHLRVNDELENIAKSGLIADSHIEEHVRRIDRFFTTPTLTKDQKTFSEILTILENIESQSDAQAIKAAYAILKKKFPKAVQGKEENLQNLLDLKKTTAEKLEAVEKKLQEIDASKRRIVKEFLALKRTKGITQDDIQTFADMIIDSAENANHSLEWWAREWGIHGGWFDTFLDHINEDLINGLITEANQAFANLSDDEREKLLNYLKNPETIPGEVRDDVMSFAAEFLKNLDVSDGVPFQAFDVGDFMKNEQVSAIKKTIKDKRAKNLAARTAYEQKVAAGEEATLTQEKVPSPIEVTARLAQEYVDDIKQKVRLLNRLVSSYEVIDQEPTIVTQQNYRQNPLVAETVLWDLKNARFVYVDAFDNPYTHGILPIIPETHDINVKYETPKGSHLSGIDAVERMQYDIRRFFDEYDALNDGPEFRELMEAKLRNAMLVLVDWYSDRTAELKPGKLGSFLEEGGPGAFNFDGKRSSLYNDRIFDPAKGVWHVGHLDREKIKKINVDYWVGGIVAALLHGDYDASEGYTGFGAIITWLAKEIDGTRSGVRRSGYAVTASSIEKAIKGLKDEQKKMQAEIDAEKKPEHFVLEKWQEIVSEGIPNAIKELEKQKADLEKNGEKIVDLTFEDDISPLQIERIRRYHSGENLMVFKVEQFLTDNIATYRSLIDTAPNFGRENRIPYFKRKLKEAKEELEKFRKKRVYLLVERAMGFTTEVDALLAKSLNLVNKNKFSEALESATQARNIAREMLDEASEDNGLAATAETIESIYDFVESLARSELRANIDPSTIPSTFGAYGDYPKIELELAKGFALHLHAGALSLANATIGESVSITAYEDAFHLDSLMTTLESQTESGRETLQKLRNNVEMIKSFRRLRNEVFGELTTKNRWSEEEANVFIEKFEALVRVVYAIDLIDESMRESALKKWQEFQERYQQLPREGKTPGSQKLNPMALNIFFSEMRKLWTEEEIHTIEAVDSFNKFINWMHSRVEENVFNLNEKNKYGLIDLDELVKQKKSPSRKVFEGLDAENQNILFEGNSVWLVKRLGIHHMEAYANFASPELGGLIEFNYLEEQDMKKGNVLRLKLMRTYFENLGFTVSSYRADGKDMKLYSPNALRIKLGSEAKSVNELISKMRYGFEFLSNLFNTDLMLGDLAVGYEDFELVEDPDKPAPVFRIARDASGSAAMARMDYANQAMERLVVAWAQKARRVGGRLYFSGSPTSLIEDPTSRNKWKVPDKDEFEREGARVVTSERRGIRATTDTRGAIVDYFWDGEDPYSDTQTVAFDRYARKIYNILQAHLRELKLEEMPPFDMESFDQIFIDQHYNEAIVRAVKKGSLNWQEGKLSINKDYVPFIPEIQFISQWQDNPETMVLMGSYLHKVLLSLQPSGEIGDAHIEVGEFSFLDASITVTVARRNSDGRIVAATVYSHEKDRYLSTSEVYTILKANNMSSRQIPNISDERIESYIRANDSTFKAISSNDIFIGKPFVGQAFLSGVRSGTIVFKAKQLPSEDQARRNRALHIGDILFTSKMTDADLNVLKQTSLGGVVTQQGVQNSHLNTAAKTIGKPRVNLSSGRIDSDGLWLMKASELSKAIIEEGYRIRLAPEDSRDWIELQEGDLVTMNGNTGTVYWVGQDDADLLEAHRLISELMNFQQEIAVNSNTVKIDAALVEKGEEYEANLISFVNRMGRESKLEPIQFILQQIFFSDFNAVSFNREALISSVAEIARQKATLKKHLQQILLYSQYRLLASFQIASNEIQISLRIDQVYSILDKLNLEATRYFNLAQSLRPLLGSEVDHREIALWIQNINKQFKDKLASLKVRLEETLANFYQENDGKALDLTRFFLLKRLSERVLEFNRLGLNFDPKDESVAYVFDNYKRLGDEIKVLHAAAVSEEKVLLPFPKLEIEFSDLVGNKAGNLGWLDHFLDWYREQGHEGIALAPGFGVTNAAWQQFLRVSFAGTSSFSSSTIGEFIDKVLQSRLSYEEKENQIAKAFDISNVTDELIKNILNGLPDLEKKKPRAVRSSTTVEDSPDDAAAGLFRSNLGANHEESIFKSLLDTWSSFFSARALAYREASLEGGSFLSAYDVQGAIIQELVDADAAGVTTSASMNDRTEIITEAGYGLGISIVDATQDADSWVFHKTTGQIDPQKTRLGLKRTKVVYDAENASVKTVVIKDETLRNKYSLDNKMVVKIAKLVAEIERWYGYVVQVEWAVKDGVLYVKQVRPLPGFKVTPERKEALQRWLDSEAEILDSDTRHELRNSEEILKQLRESTHVIDWTEGLKALQEDDAENQIAVTLHLARGVKLPFQVDRRILTDKELNRRLHRFLAAWAYNAGTIFGTDFIAADLSDLENKIKIELSEQASEKSVLKRFKNNLIDFFVSFFENFMGIHFWQGLPLMSSFIKWLDQQSSDLRPVHISELKRLLAEDLGNIRETRGDIKHKPYGIGDYANAGKEVRVVDAKSVELAAEPSSDFDLKNPVDVNYPGLYLGIDIGGNSAKFALIYNGNFLVAPEHFQFMSTNTAEKESPQSYMDRLSLHSRQIAQWARESGYGELDGVGVDMPGVVDIASNQMITIGQISSPENKDWTSDQIGEIKQLIPKLVTDLDLEDENSKISRGIIRNDMDGVLSGVLAVLNQLNHSFLEATGQVFRFDWMGTGHGFQFSIGAPLPAPTEGGHIIYNFGEKGSLIYDTESETAIPRLIQIAIDAGFPKDELIDDEGRFHMLPLGQALVEGGKESDSRRHAIAVEVYEAFAQAYAKNLVVGFQLAEMTGIVNASNVLLGGGIIRGETGKFVKTFVEKELEKLGYNGKINITLMSDEDVEKVIPKSDFLGPYGIASLAQQHVKNQLQLEGEDSSDDLSPRHELREVPAEDPDKNLKQVVLQQLSELMNEIDFDEVYAIQQLVINENFDQAHANVKNLMIPFSPEYAVSVRGEDEILLGLYKQLEAIANNLEKLIPRSELRIALVEGEFKVIPGETHNLVLSYARHEIFRQQIPTAIQTIIEKILASDYKVAKSLVRRQMKMITPVLLHEHLTILSEYLDEAIAAQNRSELRTLWKAPIDPVAIKQRIAEGKEVPAYYPLDIQLHEDGNAFGEVAAQKIIDKVREFPDAVIILPTGSTPGGMYSALIRRFKEDPTIDFSKVRFFNLDEYLDLEEGHPLSYQIFMEKKLYEALDAIAPNRAPLPENRNIPSVTHMTRFAAYDRDRDTENYDGLRAAYEKRLQDAIKSTGRKAADLAFLGAGGAYPIEDKENGGFLRDNSGEYILHGFHIGFNEPGSEVDSRTSIIPLTLKTQKDTNYRFRNITRRKDYHGQWKSVVPMRAISMGVANILESHEIVLMANGEEKSIVLERAYKKSKPDPDFPGSYLMYHPHVTWLVDHDAASRLPHVKRPWTVQGQVDFEWNQVTMRQAVMETLKENPAKNLTSLTAQDLVDMGISRYAIQKLGGLNKIKEDVANFLNPYLDMKDNLLPKNEDVVIFSPHPDDDVITSGVTMKKLQDRGNNVHVVYLVGGANAVRESLPAYKKEYQALREQWKVESKNVRLSAAENSKLKQKAKFLVRMHEAEKAAGTAGVPKQNLHFLDLPYYFARGFVDQNPIDPINDTKVVVDLLNSINAKKRKLNLFYSAEQDPHGAHGIGAEVVRQSLQSDKLKISRKVQVWGYRGAYEEWPVQNPKNLVIVPFGEELMELKKKAILEHASQVNPLFPSFDPREFWERVWDRNGGTGKLFKQMGYLSEIKTAAFAEIFKKFTVDEFLGRSELRLMQSNEAQVTIASIQEQSLEELKSIFKRLQPYLGDYASRRWVAFHITQGIYLPLPADIDTNLRNDLINFIRYDLFHFDGVEEISETQNPAALDISIINAGVFGEFESAEEHLYAVAQNLTAQPKAYIHEIILVENENDVEALRERTQIEMKRFADQTRTWNLADRYKLEVVSRRELNRRINQIVSDRFENVRGAIDALTPAEFAQKHVTFSSDSRQVLDSLVSNIEWLIDNDLDSRIAVQAVRLQKALELGSGADAALIRKLTGISAINRMISAANDLISAGELDKAVQLWNEMLSKRQIYRSA
jgi:glucosamine-6-phosphate deaminase